MAKEADTKLRHSKKQMPNSTPLSKLNKTPNKNKNKNIPKIEQLQDEAQKQLKLKKSPHEIVTYSETVSMPVKQHTPFVDKSNVVYESCTKQLDWFLNAFRTGTGTKLSSLELQEIPGNCMVELINDMDHSIRNLGKHVKAMFGPTWKEVLFEGNLLERNVEPGSPAILIISSSAARCVEVLRGLHEFTINCHAAKLFAKHIKIEEQVSILKGRVNIAGGTPNRIKNLIDAEALGISRLSVLLLDMHKDAKGLTLFTVPQVSGQFWDLYKTHFHKQVTLGKLKLCLY